MYCGKCGTKLNEEGLCPKCNNLPKKQSKSFDKIILLITLLGFIISALCGGFVYKLTETEVYHDNSWLAKELGKPVSSLNYTSIEHNIGAMVCIIFIGIVATIGIDIYVYIKNKNN